MSRLTVRRFEYVPLNFMFATTEQLRAAERRKWELEEAGYVLTGHSGNRMVFERKGGIE